MITSTRKAGAIRAVCPTATLLLCLATLLLPAVSRAAGPVELLIARSAVVRSLPPAANARADDLRLQLQSDVTNGELRLTPNRSLGVLATRLAGRAQAYRGELAGRSGSWVALTRIGARWSGVIFDGTQYFGVDEARSLAGISADAARAAPDATLVYRLSDLRLDPAGFEGDMLLPSAEALAQLLEVELSQPVTAQAITAAATLATRRLDVALIADAELAAQDGAQTETNMLARLNIVDGIFSNQVGVHLQSLSVTVLGAGSQPFTQTDASMLLDEVKNYRFGTSTQRAAGLSHLMTGRNLDGRTVGIAYIGGLCSNSFSASLSEARNSTTFDALVAAHEIGHVFGAPHDSEAASACETTANTFVMAPQLNGSSTFSQCSLDQIAPVVTRASCLAPLDAADGTVEVPTDVALPQGQPADVTVTVRSVGTATLSNTSLRISVPISVTLISGSSEAGACTLAGQVADCPLGSMAAATSRSVTFRVQSATAITATATLRVSAANDGLASNNTRSLPLRFAPGADLAAGATLDATSITVGGTVNAVVTFDNRGPANVIDGRVVITLPAGLTLQSQTAEGTTCAAVSEGLTCGPQALAAGSTARVTLALRGETTGSYTVNLAASSSAPELQAADNASAIAVQVNPVPVANPGTSGGTQVGSGGGGGGSLPVGAVMLLALLAAGVARARRQDAAVAAAKYFAR